MWVRWSSGEGHRLDTRDCRLDTRDCHFGCHLRGHAFSSFLGGGIENMPGTIGLAPSHAARYGWQSAGNLQQRWVLLCMP